MDHLRFLENNNKPGEFYTDDLKAVFLKGIAQLNVIVGANNTRKSRFIRQLINLEHKVTVESDIDFNKVFQDLSTLFDDIEPQLLEGALIEVHFKNPQNPTDDYKVISSFFNEKSGSNFALGFFDIRDIFKNLTEHISNVAIKDQIKPFHERVEKTLVAFKWLYHIYKGYETSMDSYSDTRRNVSDVPGITFSLPGVKQHATFPDFAKKLNWLRRAVAGMNIFNNIKLKGHDVHMIYIPVLRSSRRLEGADEDLFEKTLRAQYTLTDNGKLSIETGLDLYSKIEVARNGHRADRENFASFERFVSQVFFQGRLIDIVAVKAKGSIKNDVRICIEGEKDDVPIYDLGDGVQGVINLLLPIFTAKENSWIFIDEPENHLHPGYQNIFIRAITDNEQLKAKNLKYFINTHSNHILSEALLSPGKTEVLVFSKRDKESSNISSFGGNEYNTLEMLGVLNTSVLVSNCSIWVEGVTDRLYLRSFMNAYCNAYPEQFEPIEGFNYSFVEYAGSNLVHYDFDHKIENIPDEVTAKMKAYFLNSNVFLLADSDFSNDDKHAFYEGINKPNFHYFKTELPEIENLLPEIILKSWLINDVKCKEFEVEACFKKPNKALKLGRYFDQKFALGKGKRKFMEPGKGGTLRPNYKTRLAAFLHQGVSDGSITWGHLQQSEIIERLVSKVLKFIQEKNQK